MARMTALRCRMIEDMKIHNLSPVTQRCYVHAVAKFARHFNWSPDLLGLAEVRAYQIHLSSTGASWAGFNVAVSALRFFYGVTLGRAAMIERIPYARKQQQLPVILSADEVVRFFAAVPSLKHRTALMAAYAAGLRVSEVVRLRVADIGQGPHADPGRTGQGTSGPVRHAVGAAARHVARLLARNPTETLAVPGPRREPPARRKYAPLGVPECSQGGELGQPVSRIRPASDAATRRSRGRQGPARSIAAQASARCR